MNILTNSYTIAVFTKCDISAIIGDLECKLSQLNYGDSNYQFKVAGEVNGSVTAITASGSPVVGMSDFLQTLSNALPETDWITVRATSQFDSATSWFNLSVYRRGYPISSVNCYELEKQLLVKVGILDKVAIPF